MKEFVQPFPAADDPAAQDRDMPSARAFTPIGWMVASRPGSPGLGSGPVARWVVFAALAMTGISVLLGQITRGAIGG